MIIRNLGYKKAWTARYGGDEFLICLNGIKEDEAQLIMKQIQKDVEKIPISIENESIKLSLSFGIKTMEEIPITAKEMIRDADKKMYLAKKQKL